MSDSWLALLGYRRDEVIGRAIVEFLPPGGAGRPPASSADRRRARWTRLGAAVQRRDGSVVEALVSARIERAGDQTWAVCVVIDITARRRAEEALRASEERLHQAQKMEAVGQLTGGIAHDFNNTLQGISGALELLERRIAQGRPEAASALCRRDPAIGRARGRADASAAGLRAPAGAAAAARGPECDRARPGGPDQALGRPGDPDPLRLGEAVWPALCDPIQLESAIVNLVINARDAMPDGGHLTITTGGAPARGERSGGGEDVKPGDYVEIAVADDGPGMPPTSPTHAFEPFFTTKPAGQGTGLGLSQLYGFVRQSGGFVRLETEPGRGTTVRLYLPRHSSGRCQAADRRAARSCAGGPGAAARHRPGRG